MADIWFYLRLLVYFVRSHHFLIVVFVFLRRNSLYLGCMVLVVLVSSVIVWTEVLCKSLGAKGGGLNSFFYI